MKLTLKRVLALMVALVLCVGLLPQSPLHVHAVSQTAGITNTVAVGDKIVIATRDGSGAMGAQSGKFRARVDATVADRVLTVSEETVVLTVEAGTKSGTFALKAADGYLYYDAAVGGNTLHTKAEKDDSASWNISFEYEDAVITNVATAERVMQYNEGSPRFACYKGTQQKVAIYRVGKAPVAASTCDHSVTDFVCSKCGRVIAPAADSTMSLKDAATLGTALGGDYTVHKYYVSGKVQSVDTSSYAATMTIEDEKGDTLYIYTFTNGMDQEITVAVGDTVKLYGVIGSYNGSPQMKNAEIKAYTAGGGTTAPECQHKNVTDYVCECGKVIPPKADSKLTLPNATKLGVAMNGAYTEGKYYVEGEIKSIASTVYGNMTIVDAKGNELYIYGTYSADGATRYDALEVQPAVGDTVKLYGVIGSYKGAAQMKSGWIVEHTKPCAHENVEGFVCECGKVFPPKADTALTLPNATKLGEAMNGSYTEGKYYVEGVIESIANTKYGNLTIKDKDGNTLYIYGTYSADGATRFDKLEVQPAVGDTVKIYGVVGSYKGTAQVKNGWIVEHNCAHAETTVENAAQASCAAPGYTGDTVCTSCGATVQKGEEIPQEEHTYVSVVTPPTYAAAGFTTHTCSGCGHKYITDHQEALTPDVDLDVNVETPDVGELKEMLKQVTKETADAFISTAKKVIDENPELREAVQPLIEAAKAIKNEVQDLIPDDLPSNDPRDLVGSLADLFF